MTEIKKIKTDRSRIEDKNRCSRLRYLGYHAGRIQRGIVPKKKSVHLILGGAYHVGMAMLLGASQQWLWDNPDMVPKHLWEIRGMDGKTVARQIEDAAVILALDELARTAEHGIELDMIEAGGANDSNSGGINSDLSVLGGDSGVLLGQPSLNAAARTSREDSPIEITFENLETESTTATTTLEGYEDQVISTDSSTDSSVQTGMDAYLKEELSAQVEAMIRCFARRRLLPVLEQFEILEVEREGEWALGAVEHDWIEVDEINHCKYCGISLLDTTMVKDGTEDPVYCNELWFMSRHDGLLREKLTNALYLMSFKTTGSWDKRKRMTAEVDQQGLSEAVDIEKRLAEAWKLLNEVKKAVQADEGNFGGTRSINIAHVNAQKIRKLVNDNVAVWLDGLAEPPSILGVRYEFILKGARKEDKKAQSWEPKWVAETPLIRAYTQEGITHEDRAWAWTYEWCEISGKSRRLDYRSWKKQPIWKHLPIADWIDLLDQGAIQPDTYDEAGNPLDALEKQLIPSITVYRNEDDMRDWLEQTEFLEIDVAQKSELVARALAQGPGEYRSALNRYFPQNRNACFYPGKCQFFEICFGSVEIRLDPEASGLYLARVPNHPQELEQ